MLFTNNEIVFLTSVSKGCMPFGIHYKMPKEGEKEAFIEDAIQSLMQKGILNEERKLTQEGRRSSDSLSCTATVAGISRSTGSKLRLWRTGN